MKFVNKIPKMILIPVLCIALAACCVLVSLYSGASQLGKAVGTSMGSVAGTVSGSLEGKQAGQDKGKEDALNAEEIKVDISDFKVPEKLTVMELCMTLTDLYTTEGKDYMELYSYTCMASYTVDLSNLTYSKDKGIYIVPDVVAGEPYNVSKRETITTYSKTSNTGSTENGIIAEQKSEEKIKNAVTAKLNDVNLGYKKEARESAKRQVKELIKAATGKDVEVKGAWE